MTISRAGSTGLGFTGRIDGNSPAAGSNASLGAAAPDDLSDAIADIFADESGDVEVDHAQVDAALGRIMAMSIEQAAAVAMAQPPGRVSGGAMAVVALLRARAAE
ncbi:MAG: hypothetical protein V4787_18515 [Pseudomonadota bacterium]